MSQLGAGKVAKLLQAEFVARVEVAETGNEGGPDVWSMAPYPNLAVPIPGLHANADGVYMARWFGLGLIAP